MGRYLAEHGKKDNSLVKLASEHDVPIFCPAFVDSSAGLAPVQHQVERLEEDKPYLPSDAGAAFREFPAIKIEAGTAGRRVNRGGLQTAVIPQTSVCPETTGHA